MDDHLEDLADAYRLSANVGNRHNNRGRKGTRRLNPQACGHLRGWRAQLAQYESKPRALITLPPVTIVCNFEG